MTEVNDDREEQAIIELKHRTNDAVVRRDFAEIRRAEGEDFIVTYPDGHLGTREEQIADWETGKVKIVSATADDLTVRLYGHTAILLGRDKITAQIGEQSISGAYRFTDVLLKRKGEWQFVASQSTPLAQA
jgi:Domain of unknown function (DUF4440)